MERLMMYRTLISTLFMVSSCSLGAKDELFGKFEYHARTLNKKTCAGFWAGRNKKAISAELIGLVKIR
jgi:hypothetical protein